jgi:hypothetical protein
MYLASGMAAGNAADSDWDTLIAERIFEPQGVAIYAGASLPMASPATRRAED